MRTLLFVLLATASAAAHDAPSGWAYGSECCSTMDCFEEQDKNVGEVIPYADKRVKISKDAKYHRCTRLGDPKMPRSICIYVPNRGS